MKFHCPLSLEDLKTMSHSLILILMLHQLFSVILTLSRNSFRKLLETGEPFLSVPWIFIPFKLNLLYYYYCIIVLVNPFVFKCLYFFDVQKITWQEIFPLVPYDSHLLFFNISLALMLPLSISLKTSWFLFYFIFFS